MQVAVLELLLAEAGTSGGCSSAELSGGKAEAICDAPLDSGMFVALQLRRSGWQKARQAI